MSDLAAMGFSYYGAGQNAFQACVPRSVPRAPIVISPELQAQRDRKNATYRRTTAQKAADLLMTEGERAAAKILRDNAKSSFCVPIPGVAERDKTARVRKGRVI